MTKTIAEIWNGNLDPVRYYGVDNHETKLLEALMGRQAFCDGFSLGGRIVAEALVAPLPME